MAKTTTTDPSWQPLREIACLLQLAADRLWEAADTAGADSPLHSLGLGSFLAASEVTEMLPADGEVPDQTATASSGLLPILEAVEQLTRRLDPRVQGASELSLTVTDLVREARHSAA